jgi:hypothetical protein
VVYKHLYLYEQHKKLKLRIRAASLEAEISSHALTHYLFESYLISPRFPSTNQHHQIKLITYLLPAGKIKLPKYTQLLDIPPEDGNCNACRNVGY